MRFIENWKKFELYIVSLWLLFFLIIIITVDIPYCWEDSCSFIGFEELILTNILPSISLFLLCAGVIFYLRFDYRLSGSKKIASKIIKIEDYNYEHLTFLTTYIIPLICFNLASTRYVIALILLLIVIGIIYVRTDKFYANPTLAVLGYRLYKIDIETRTTKKENVILITKDRLILNDQINTLDLDEKVYFARKVQ
tara:strand:+ start:720 stop:1307 length:588 start_codon:yes stop_codon:yes gene_type:complete